MPSRETLRGQIVGAVQAPLAQLVGLLTAPQRELVYVLAERGKAVFADGAGAPATEVHTTSQEG
jgi:ribosomal protein L10